MTTIIHHRIAMLAFALITFIVGASPASAGTHATFVVPRAEGQILISWDDLSIPETATDVTVSRMPLHASTFSETADTFTFSPATSFWSAGTDLFQVSYESLGSHQVTALLVAGGEGVDSFTSGFEIGDAAPSATNDPNGWLTIGAAGAVLDQLGLLVNLDGTGGDAYLAYTIGDMELGDTGEGGRGCDGGTGVTIASPSNPPPPVEWIGGEISILTANRGSAPVARIQLGLDSGVISVRAEVFNDDGSTETTPWAVLPDGVHRLRLDWWSDSEGGGISFSSNDQLVGEIRTASNGLQYATEYRIGAQGAPAGLDLDFQLDRFVARNGEPVGDGDLSRWATFDGTLADWDEVRQTGGTVVIDPVDETLEITMGSGWGAYVRTDEPAAEGVLVARFRFDTTLLTMGVNDKMNLLMGYPEIPLANHHIVLAMRPSGDDFEVRATARDDQIAAFNSPWTFVKRGAGVLEARWRAASGPGTDDGYLRLWLDGTQIGALEALDNDARPLESLIAGAMGIDAGTFGVLTLDDITYWFEPKTLPSL